MSTGFLLFSLLGLRSIAPRVYVLWGLRVYGLEAYGYMGLRITGLWVWGLWVYGFGVYGFRVLGLWVLGLWVIGLRGYGVLGFRGQLGSKGRSALGWSLGESLDLRSITTSKIRCSLKLN